MRALIVGLCVGLCSLSPLTSAPALACFDGSVTTVAGLTLQDGDDVWSATKAVEHAQWLTRIARLLPGGTSLEIWPYSELTVGDEVITIDSDGDLAALYDVIAQKLHVSPWRAAWIRRLPVPVWTIQAGAFTSEREALARAELIGSQCPHGFYEAGGFPADNAAAHVERNVDGRYRVIVGTFLGHEEARSASACLDAIEDWERDRTVRIEGFVRRLDRPSFLAFSERVVAPAIVADLRED